ncbi:ribonuclease H-like domain-containing protein [Tanacetum coccineum]
MMPVDSNSLYRIFELDLVSEPVVNELNIKVQPKVWSDAPIIEEYESDSEDEFVTVKIEGLDTPSFANKQVKTPRENVKHQSTTSQKPKVNHKELGHEITQRGCFVCGSFSHLIRDCDYHVKLAKQVELHKQNMSKGNGTGVRKQTWNNVQRVNKQNQFVPLAVQTRTGTNPVNAAKASSTKNFSTARQSVNRQTVLTSTALKVNTVQPMMSDVRSANVFHKTNSPSSRPFKRTTVLRTNLANQKVYTAKIKELSTVGEKWVIAVKSSASCKWRTPGYNNNILSKYNDNPHRNLQNKGIIDSGCSRHMTGNKAYLADFQDFNGGPVAFGGSKGYITGKLDFEDVSFVKELQHFNLFSVSQMCDKKNKVKRDQGEYSNCRTPQQMEVAERKNMTLIEAARTMPIADSFLHNTFGLNSLVYLRIKLTNQGMVNKNLTKIQAQKTKLMLGILKKKMNLLKTALNCQYGIPILQQIQFAYKIQDNKIVGSKKEEQVLSGRSCKLSKAKKEANEKAEALRESLEQETENLVTQAGAAKSSSTNIFSTVSTTAKASGTNLVNTVSIPVSTASANEGLSLSVTTNSQEDDYEIPSYLMIIMKKLTDGIFTHSSYDDEGAEADFTNLETVVNVSPIPTSRINPSHPSTLILGDPTSAVQTRSKVNKSSEAHAFFEIQKVWILVDLPYGKKAIGTKWVYRNKKDERGVVVRNKARLVAQGHRQEEGIDYDEVFAPVARLEAIRIFLAFASYMGFIVYQMDVKSAFLYGKIDEEVYRLNHQVFLDPKYPEKVYKVVKSFVWVHQAPIACVKSQPVQPIETQKPLVKDEEASDVDVHLYRSMIGSLMYVTASRPDIMFAVCACSRFQVTPKTSHLSVVKRIFRYLKGKPKLGLWYPRESSFDLESYSDSDYAGANLDRKSTTGEAEYVAAASCCGQVLWIQNQMLDYGFNFMNTKIYIDNESTICIVKNPVYHSKTKHIAIRHHFIRDAYEKKLIQVIKIHTDDNVADLLTKAFDVSRFQFLVVSIGMINP